MTARTIRLPARRASAGFSLIELMIGVALGLVILAALTSFFVSSSANRHEIERSSRQIENGRFAIDTLRNELVLAGFYADISQSGATYTAADACETDLANLGLGPSPLNIPLPVYGYAADTATFPACITNRVADTDVLVVRRLHTEPVAKTAADALTNQAFVQPSRCATDSLSTPWAFAVGGSGSFTLHSVDCTNLAPLYRYRSAVFYIRSYSATPSDGIPTLVRLDLDRVGPSLALTVSPMVEGVRAMRVMYGIDTDANGSPDVFRRCDAASACTIADWSNVTTVRVNVLAENLEDSREYTDATTYDLGGGYTVPPINDHRKRHVYAATISLPNRTGPRE
jgi:type IV pilus assembly protein PilW